MNKPNAARGSMDTRQQAAQEAYYFDLAAGTVFNAFKLLEMEDAHESGDVMARVAAYYRCEGALKLANHIDPDLGKAVAARLLPFVKAAKSGDFERLKRRHELQWAQDRRDAEAYRRLLKKREYKSGPVGAIFGRDGEALT